MVSLILNKGRCNMSIICDNSPNLKRILAHTTLFHMLDARQLDTVAAHSSAIHVGSHGCIVDQGDVAEGTYWLVYGQVRLGLYSKQGGEKTLEILGPSKCFGLAEMMLGRPHLAFAKATADSMLVHTERGAMMQVAQENFAFSQEMMSCLGRQFYGLVRDIGSYAQTARQRVAGYLLAQARRENSAAITLVASKVLVASRLSLTPETFSRLLRELCAEGLIAVTGRRVDIIDDAGLAALLA
jgi:CRP/FNR family transcriptional regulator, dissimilatory nitrate respiration regulator